MPGFFVSQRVYCLAVSNSTFMTGRRPLPQPWSLGTAPQPTSRTHASHSSKVTSYLPMANALAIRTGLVGFSCFSPLAEPMMKMPGGTTTISGQAGQSRNTVPGFGNVGSGAAGGAGACAAAGVATAAARIKTKRRIMAVLSPFNRALAPILSSRAALGRRRKKTLPSWRQFMGASS